MGKTTTTSLTAWMLTAAGADPSLLVGGIALNFGSDGEIEGLRASRQGREFVIEGDEYDSAFFDKTAKFLKYLPDIAVINNVEFDHARASIIPILRRGDRYSVPAAHAEPWCREGQAFAHWRRQRTPRARAPAAKVRLSRVETFGLSTTSADWRRPDDVAGGRRAPDLCGSTWPRLFLRQLRPRAARPAQRPKRPGRYRRWPVARPCGDDHRRSAARVPRRQATS